MNWNTNIHNYKGDHEWTVHSTNAVSHLIQLASIQVQLLRFERRAQVLCSSGGSLLLYLL